VAETFVVYLVISFCGAGLLHAAMFANLILNAVGHPLAAAGLSCMRLFLFMVPLAYLGGTLYGLRGVFAGVAVSNVLSAVVAMAWVRRVLDHAGTTTSRPP